MENNGPAISVSEDTATGRAARTAPSQDTVASNDSASCDSLGSKDCDTCPDRDKHSFVSPSEYKLKPGEMMFDREGSTASNMSLSTFIRCLNASNVYDMFFTHTQVCMKDSVKCFSSFYKHPTSNRFADIPCIEETRVKVKHPLESHDYIHASWVDGYREPRKFIVGQSPLPSTIEQFWRMIWNEKALVVVGMIQMYDVKSPEITLRYIPTKVDEIFKAGEITVRHNGTRRIRDTYDATILKVTLNGDERTILHMCYFDWSDKGTPTRPSELINLVGDMNYNRDLLMDMAKKAGWLKAEEYSPITLHCLAGTGRSCVIVALDICYRKLDDTAKRLCGPLVDVKDVVLRLRTQRAMAIQKAEQYMLLHFSVFEYAIRNKQVPEEIYGEGDLERFKYGRRLKTSTDQDQSDVGET